MTALTGRGIHARSSGDVVERMSWKVSLGETPRVLHRAEKTSGLFSCNCELLWPYGSGEGGVPRGMNVFFPLTYLTPGVVMVVELGKYDMRRAAFVCQEM